LRGADARTHFDERALAHIDVEPRGVVALTFRELLVGERWRKATEQFVGEIDFVARRTFVLADGVEFDAVDAVADGNGELDRGLFALVGVDRGPFALVEVKAGAGEFEGRSGDGADGGRISGCSSGG
jgi:hypothetical protein